MLTEYDYICHIKSVQLRLSLDQLNKPFDPKIFGFALQQIDFFTHIQLWPDSCQPGGKNLFQKPYNIIDILKHCKSDPNYTSPRKSRSRALDDVQIFEEDEEIPLSESPQLSFPIFEGISKCLQASQKLQSLQLIKLQLSDESWEQLAIGIADSQSIKVLQLNLMPLPFKGLDQLTEAVRLSTSIERIDLSMNDMDDEYGSIVAKFIQSQQDMKELLKWKGSLRGRHVQLNYQCFFMLQNILND